VSDASEYINRRCMEVAAVIGKALVRDSHDEVEGGVLLLCLLRVALGSLLADADSDFNDGVTATFAPPALVEDGDIAFRASKAALTIAAMSDGDEPLTDADTLVAMLQGVVAAMTPIVCAHVEAERATLRSN
jgi:hypothetical protein